MDFDLALFLILNALKAPNKLYQHTKRLKQIRNHWHRDDPCLTAVIIGAMILLSVAYSIMVPLVTKEERKCSIIVNCVYNIIKLVFIQFLLFGVLISALFKWIAETFLMKSEKKMASSGGTSGYSAKTGAID